MNTIAYSLLFLLAFCVASFAAPKKPLPPTLPNGVRFPVLSPAHKATKAKKDKPMMRQFTPAGELNKFYLTHQLDFDIDGDGKIIRDVTTIEAVQKAGKGLRVEFSDDLILWTTVADWAPYVSEQTIIVQQWCIVSQRSKARNFRCVDYVNSPGLKWRPASLAFVTAPIGNGVRTWVKLK